MMKPQHFRSRPVVIEAMQYTLDSRKDVLKCLDKHGHGTAIDEDGAEYDLHAIRVHTSEGTTHAEPGYWIARDSRGGFYPIHPDVFMEKYEPVEITNRNQP